MAYGLIIFFYPVQRKGEGRLPPPGHLTYSKCSLICLKRKKGGGVLQYMFKNGLSLFCVSAANFGFQFKLTVTLGIRIRFSLGQVGSGTRRFQFRSLFDPDLVLTAGSRCFVWSPELFFRKVESGLCFRFSVDPVSVLPFFRVVMRIKSEHPDLYPHTQVEDITFKKRSMELECFN